MTKQKKKVSILGTGWLGLPLAKHFIQNGWQVKGCSTRLEKLEPLKSNNIQPYLINIDSIKNTDKSFFDSEILIINITSKNTESYKNLINQIEQSYIRFVLFVSSTSVYDNCNCVVTEDSPTNNSELANIERLFLKSKNFQTTVLRFGGLFGYDRQPGRFFRKGYPVSDSDACVNYIHRDDCIDLIEQIVFQKKWGNIFNGVADTHPSKREFYTYMSQLIGLEPPKFADSDITNFKQICNKKIKSALNYQFKVADLMNYKLDN